jgi:alpha-L-fucosidase
MALTALLAASLTVATSSLALPHAETPAQRDARMKWWREARFGMFIHWGLYALPAGTWEGKDYPGIGEWLMHDAKVPVSDYSALAKRFNPVDFDAKKWISVAKRAGMKYLVITSKHHDGFALFPSKASPYNIRSASPFARDPLAELASECRRQGLKFGLYYSQAQDWYHPGGAAYGGHWDPAQDGDQKKYVMSVAAPQVAEIVERYRPDVLWWDTPVEMSPEEVKALSEPLRKLPRIITNNRLGNGVAGDTETPEQFIPAKGYPGRDWETCMTINDTWGFKAKDVNFKPTRVLVRNLIDIASKGGNYLLNVGPDARGIIPQPEIDRLLEVGQWLDKNGASIYGSSASPYQRLPFEGRATVRGNRLYLHVFEWPERFRLGGLRNSVRGAKVLATGEKLQVSNEDGNLLLSAPKVRDAYATTVELQLDGPPKVEEPEVRIALATRGTTLLTATDAELTGSLQVEHTPPNLGYWTEAKDSPSWKVSATEGGVYTVTLEYACDKGSGGSSFVLQVDGVDTETTGEVEETGSWSDYRTMKLDKPLAIPAGRHTVRIRVKSKPGTGVMNLRTIRLTSNEG